MKDSCNQKKKTKDRKELWDSLLQVYEKEADKENVGDVSVADIEKWTICHPNDSPRAFPLINPTIIFNALQGKVGGSKTAQSKTIVNLKQVARGKKRKKDIALNDSSLGSLSSKSKRKNCSTKKTAKQKATADNSGLVKVTSFSKKQRLKSNEELKQNRKKITLVNSSANLGKKKKRKSIKDSDMKVTKTRPPSLKNAEDLKKGTPQHTCNLTLSYYSNEEIPSTRADGRVFRCKLVVRICECFKSDEKAPKLNAKESDFPNALQTQEDLQHKEFNKLQYKKKTKARQSKNILANQSNKTADKLFVEKGKEKIREKVLNKYKFSSKYLEVLSKLPEEEQNNPPVVIWHHRGEKPFQKSKEHLSIDSKNLLNPNRTRVLNKDYRVKKRNESNDHSQSKSKAKVDDNSSLKDIKPPRDKVKNRQDKCAIVESPNVIAEPKLKKKRQRISKQVIPIVDSSSNPNDNIINQMKSIPIRIEDDPLTFMNLFRSAQVFNGHKNQKKFDDVMKLYCEKLKQKEKKKPKDSLIPISKEHENKVYSSESLRKLYKHKRATSKLLKEATSSKRLRKCKNRSVMSHDAKKYCERENFDSISVSVNSIKSRKDLKKKRAKYLISKNSAVNKTLIRKLDNFLSKEKFNLSAVNLNKKVLHDHHFKGNLVGFRPECGDGIVGEFTSQPSSQNNKLSTIYSESISTGTEKKDPMETDLLKVDITKQGDSEIHSNSNIVLKNNDLKKFGGNKIPISSKDVGKISIVKPTVSEDGKKLTFQLVKADQFYKLNNKFLSKASKETLPVKKDKLMLFYSKRESSCTSKDSLNVAISRDTEISNNGSSNNVLNVVIKQTKSMLSNSKTPPSRDFELEKECQKMNELNFQGKSVYNDDCERNSCEITREELSCQAQKLFAVNQTENSLTAINSEEVNSKPSIFHNVANNQHKYLNNSEFGFCCLQHSLPNKKMSFKNILMNKILNLKPSPESKTAIDSKYASPSHQKNDLNFKQQNKCQRNSPKRNKFFTVCNPHGGVESLKQSSPEENFSPPKVGYKKINNEITHIDTKNTFNPTIQSEPIDNYKLSSCNQQSPKDKDNLELKLQVVGLTQKKGFVKVIECNNDNTPQESQNIYKKPAVTSELSKNQSNVQLLGNEFSKGKIKEHYIYTKQNTINKLNISNGEDLKKKLSILKAEKFVKNIISPTQLNKGMSIELKEYIMPKTLKNSVIRENSCPDECSKTADIKQNKENFFTILPVGANDVVETNSNSETNTSDLYEQAIKKKEEVMVYSEIGVQTDFPISHRKKQSEISFKEAVDVTSLPEIDESPMKLTNYVNKNLFSQNCRIENKETVTSPTKRGSFVHIVNNKTNDCDSGPVYKNPISFLNKTIQSSLANKDKILSEVIHEKQQTIDNQLVSKINAIYEFLQYLDKVLKNTALVKQNEVSGATSNYMDNLNKTLRCLCSNCTEILNKIEVNQPMKHQHNKFRKSPKRSFSSQSTKKRSLFVSQVSPLRELEWKKEDVSNIEYVNISEVEKPVERGLQRAALLEPKTHKWNPKPFFVVVPSDEMCIKNPIRQSSGDVSKHSLLLNSELKRELKPKNVQSSKELYFQMEDEIDNLLLEKKINNSKLTRNKVNDSEIVYNRKQPNEKRIKNRNKHSSSNKFVGDIGCCRDGVRERENLAKGFYKKNVGSRRPDKCSSYRTLPRFPNKYKIIDKNNFLQRDHTFHNNAKFRSVNKVKSVNSYSSLELRFRQTDHKYSPAENSHCVKCNTYRGKNLESKLAFLQNSESNLNDNTYGQNLDTSTHDVNNDFGHCGDGLERLLNIKEAANKVLSSYQQYPTDIPYFFSSNSNQLKSESCQTFVRTKCKNTNKKSDEKLLTGSVSKNKQSIKLKELNNTAKHFQGIQNVSVIKSPLANPNLHAHEERLHNKNNCAINKTGSKASMNSNTYTASLGKSSVNKNKTVLKKHFESKYLQNEFSIFQNRDRAIRFMNKSALLAKQSQHKNQNQVPILDYKEMSRTNKNKVSQEEITETESRKSLRFLPHKLDSNSSIDSLFSQNKESLIFTNRQFPCNEDLKINNLCDCHQVIQDLTLEEQISSENAVYDSPGWISISSCELHNENENSVLNDSILSNDLEKVRLQMDIKLNDIMHVEFFCQPSDPVKLSKEKNKIQLQT